MVTPSLFNPDDYSFRKGYPSRVFECLKSFLASTTHSRASGLPVVLDLGAGSGQSTEAFLQFFSDVSMVLLEPNEKMLKAAEESLRSFAKNPVQLISGVAENIPLPNASVDLILLGSSWHWMKPEQVLPEISRVLRPQGAVFVFEYQFPKVANELNSINEWVRRQFNLHWKAPGQKPRGTLKELTSIFREHSDFAQRASFFFQEERLDSLEYFAGEIFSQSRYLHFEQAQEGLAPADLRAGVFNALKAMLGAEARIPLIYSYEGYLLQKSSFR